MERVDSTSEFWRRPELVDAYERSGHLDALPYEVDLIAEAASMARHSGEVQRVHVVGVGAGRELAAVRALLPGSEVHASDLSPGMVRACRELAQRRGWDDVTVTQAEIRELPGLVTRPADVVIALGAVLGYGTTASDRDQMLDALRDILRPGGGLAAMVQQRHGRPDWSCYFAWRAALAATRLSSTGPGNRLSRHGDSRVEFHHYGHSELAHLAATHCFVGVDITSLRRWGRANGVRIRASSPNPLLLTASRSTEPA